MLGTSDNPLITTRHEIAISAATIGKLVLAGAAIALLAIVLKKLLS